VIGATTRQYRLKPAFRVLGSGLFYCAGQGERYSMDFYRAGQRAAVCLTFLVAGCAPQPVAPIFWWDSFPLALEAAIDADKPTLVYFYADWCTMCRRVDREVFSNEEVSEAFESFVAVKIDIDKQPWLAEKYHIDAVPAYLRLDGVGNPLGHALGYKSPEEMKQLLRAWSTGTKSL
jgi:thiol-disulfide isomerase/thioredoxin